MSIIVLLISILLPSLSKAREQAKQAVCASHLGGMGKAFYLYSNENRDYLCSGAFDPEVSNGRDGRLDKVGWIADLVNGDFAFPGKMLCPSNPGRYNQKLVNPNGQQTAGAAPEEGKEFPTPEEALALVERGYNSNYTQSWYMARTQYDPGKAAKSKNPANWKRRDTTVGPLRSTDMTRAAPATVPLLGDGRIDDDAKPLFDLEGRCVATMTDGPFNGPFAIQQYDDVGPAHGIASWSIRAKGSNRYLANVLFGDAHVDVFKDVEPRDGEFGITPRPPYAQMDLSSKHVFDGVLTLGRRSLNPNYVK